MCSRYRSIALLAACICFAGMHVDAKDTVIQKADLLSFGVYAPEGNQIWADTNAVSGQISVHDSVSISLTTTNVPGVIGVKFGLEYILIGEPTNAVVEVTVIRKYPAPGLQRPKAKSSVLESKRQWNVTLGEKTGIGYGFDHEWEIVPGVWTFQIWSKEKKLLEQKFLVRKPEGQRLNKETHSTK